MTRQRLLTQLLLAGLMALLALAAAAPAGARPAKRVPAPKVTIGHPVVGTSANGLASILVPVRYPIEMAGRITETRVALIGARGGTLRSWVLHERLNSGRSRAPDRRRRFVFVHRVGLDARSNGQLRRGASVRVLASGKVDVDEDGKPELRSRDLSTSQPLTRLRPKPVCGTVPHLRVKRGARISVPLPVCDREVSWSVSRRGTEGVARVRNGRLIYKAPPAFRGTDEVRLAGGGRPHFARVTVGATSGITVRALGDSVTAGFGYLGETGKEIDLDQFPGCRPVAGNTNDACSSNSLAKKAKQGPVEYVLPDYGRARNISWAAQWANDYNITDYKNFAISGSEPSNWVPGPNGVFYETTKTIESEDPDYILLTLGANPLLSKMLTEPEDWECALLGREEFEMCVATEFEHAELRQNLTKVYGELLKNTTARIYVMQYHLSIPWSALFDSSVELASANAMLNREIASVVALFNSSRLKAVTPPHFNVGIDISPFWPASYTCRLYPVDGRSVQSYKAQDELQGHVLSFCSGPGNDEEPWVINNDTGIHPSATGYGKMANAVPPPVP